jgi:transcriptional regulator with XRE-family HTH domain
MAIEEFRAVLQGETPKDALEGYLENGTDFEMEEVDPPEKEDPRVLFKKIRDRLGYSQSKFGKMFDTSAASISRVERQGRNLSNYVDVDEVITSVTDLADWRSRDDWILLEFSRAIKGKPTREDIQKWMEEHLGDIWKNKAIFSRLEENEDGEEVYLFVGAVES